MVYATSAMKKDKPEISVIIVNYNTTKDLMECLGSIHETMADFHYETYVIDNNSADKNVLQQHIRKNYPAVKVFFSSYNMGFAAANNVGINMSHGKYLLFLNPDVVLRENCVAEMYSVLKDKKDIGIIGPLIYDVHGSIQHYCARSFPDLLTEIFKHTGLERRFPRNRIFGRYLKIYRKYTILSEVDAIQGSCMLIPREVIAKTGKMDERFFLFGEDIEWCYRIKKHGYRVVMDPKSTIIHKGEKSAIGRESITYLLGFDSMYKFFQICYSEIAGLLYRVLIFVLFGIKYMVGLLSKSPFTHLRLEVMKWSIGMLSPSRRTHE